MKKMVLTAVFATASLFANAQVEWDVTSQKDDFNGWTRYSTNTVKKVFVDSESKYYNASVSFVHFSGDEDVYVRVTPAYDGGCAGSRSNYMMLLVEDGSPIKLEEDLADIDCSDGSTSLYRVSLDQVQGKVITKVRFAQTDGYVDFDTVNGFSEGIAAVINHE